ncbi:MAG: thioredoxin family protein [Marinobacter sp.]|uniref:thioredoxin family protein n=1 Tax=Marinobacter sp. TaxID=50741 RepID=UPI00299D8EDE|nr:thioredoxin family protein [Marinobacter sp.]MDX1633787.1 thioredoxin family protein [Marinobacter sp.]
MPFASQYTPESVSRDEIDQSQGPLLIEFGTNWCGHCQAAQPRIKAALEHHAEVRHLKIEDGKGRRLGRTFGVKLWPTLIFMKDGEEVERLVRPGSSREIDEALGRIG